MPRFALLLLFLAASVAYGDTTQKALTGTVVDTRGNPVADATLCGQWGAEKGTPKCLNSVFALTDASGHFTLSQAPIWWGDLALVVFDKEHRTGALVSMVKPDLSVPLHVVLHPLVQVRYQVETPVSVKDSDLMSHLYTSSMPIVGLWGHRGAIFLPAGHYTISSGIYDSEKPSMDFDVRKSPVVLKPLRLEFSIMAQHYGHAAPAIGSLVDMGRNEAEVGSLRGHWTLLYFWENGCAPCIATGLPTLIEFTSSGQAKAANLQIYAINTRFPGAASNFDGFRSYTTKLEATLWHAVPSFPMLYDETNKTSKAWGIRMFPTYALIDPNGDLVRTETFEDVKAKLGIHNSGETIRSAR